MNKVLFKGMLDGVLTRSKTRAITRKDGRTQSTATITTWYKVGRKVYTVAKVDTRVYDTDGSVVYIKRYKLLRKRPVKASDFVTAKAETSTRNYAVRGDGLVDFADLN